MLIITIIENISEFFNNPLQAWDSEESRFFIASILFTFVLGIWTAYWIWGEQLKKLKKDNGNNQHNLVKEVSLLKRKLQTSNLNLAESTILTDNLDQEKAAHKEAHAQLLDNFDLLQEELASKNKIIKNQEFNLEELQTKNDFLQNRETEKNQTLELVKALQSNLSNSELKLEMISNKLEKLITENKKLTKQNFDLTLKFGSIANQVSDNQEGNPTKSILVDNQLKKEILEYLPINKNSRKDNLKKLSDVNSIIEQKLNALGIIQFSQIEDLNEIEEDTIAQFLKYFPEHIDINLWSKEASKILLKKKAKSPNQKSFRIFMNDDLKIINGINEKIESILKEDGIQDLYDLANCTSKSILECLLENNYDIKNIDVSLWPEHARMATSGQWGQA